MDNHCKGDRAIQRTLWTFKRMAGMYCILSVCGRVCINDNLKDD